MKFTQIDKSDIGLMMRYFERYPSRSCDYSICGTLMWSDMFGYEICESEETLFIRGYDAERDVYTYYTPIGSLDVNEAIGRIADYSESMEEDFEIITYTDIEADRADESGYTERERGMKEYLYPIDRFLHFAGKKMEKKRNHLNYFHNHWPQHEVKPITPADIPELLEFTERFMESHPDSDLFNYESSHAMMMLRDYEDYPFEGILIRIDGKIEGYSFGENIGDTFFVHVEKGNIDFRGIYQAVASEMAQYVAASHPATIYLNREDDMGDESLRQSKESYHPTLFVMKKIIPAEEINQINAAELLRIA